MDSNMFDDIDSSNIFSDVEPEDIHRKMLVGSYIRGDLLLYASGMDGGTFLKFGIEDTHQYLLENCIFRVRRNSYTPLRIVQVIVLKMGEYTVIDKTFWIRLIQRCWRSRLAQHKADLIAFIHYRETNGKYPMGARIKGKKIIGLLRK